jgi:biopolymer transport protein ExbD
MPRVQQTTSAGGGRRGRGARVATSLAEINVVPLVDVMLVLLIIFMVTAPMIQRGIDVNLRVARRTNQIEGQRVFVTVPAGYRENGIVYLGDDPVRVDVLQERVRQQLETQPDKKVYLRGDGALRYQDVMDVFDRLRDAGVEQIGLNTEAPRVR